VLCDLAFPIVAFREFDLFGLKITLNRQQFSVTYNFLSVSIYKELQFPCDFNFLFNGTFGKQPNAKVHRLMRMHSNPITLLFGHEVLILQRKQKYLKSLLPDICKHNGILNLVFLQTLVKTE